jgi:hypothetical protein
MASITGSIILPNSAVTNTKLSLVMYTGGGESRTVFVDPNFILSSSFAISSGGDVGKAQDPFTMGSSTVLLYIQRIYDSVLGSYVYYKLPSITFAPASTQTSPPHSGVTNLVVSRHELITVIQEIN